MDLLDEIGVRPARGEFEDEDEEPEFEEEDRLEETGSSFARTLALDEWGEEESEESEEEEEEEFTEEGFAEDSSTVSEAGEWESSLALEVRDEDLFEARIDPAAALNLDMELEDEAEDVAPTEPNDPPGVAERPRWPGRNLRLVRPYMRGSDVRAWQQRMIERNWLTALGKEFKDDGVFGPLTAVVTTRFQQVQDLWVDGVVGSITWGAAWTTAKRATPATTKPAVFYDRGAAVDYARRHWNVVCNDNIIAGTFGKVAFKAVPAGTKFVKDKEGEHAQLPTGTKIPWKNLDDCTHFISCCIGDPRGSVAGGLPLPSELGAPPNGPYGIVAVTRLVELLQKKKWVVLEGERSTDVTLIKKLQRGDLVAYFNEGRGRYTHLAMYLGGGKIACHSYCRFDKRVEPTCTWDDEWDLGAGTKKFTWTFIRFVV